MDEVLRSPGSSPASGEAGLSLDQAIDVVAREMTALDAPAGMRAEVLARIEGAPRVGSPLMTRWTTAASVAVVVLAVVATVWFARPGERTESVNATHNTSSTLATSGARPEPQPSEKLTARGLAASMPAGDQPSAGVRPATRGAVSVQPGQDLHPRPEMGPAALVALEPIVLAKVGPDAIHIPDIGIEPLADLKPITIQDIPPGSTDSQSPSIRKFEDDPAPSGLCPEQAF